MYNFNHLYYFYVTVKSGGVNAAAQHLKISQPSLSSQLKVLESSFENRLFQKIGRNNCLTPEGSVVYGFCRQMFEISEEMTELIVEQVPSASRRIHIGVSEEVDDRFVIEVVSSFLQKHGLKQPPKITLTSGTHAQLADRLRFREIDAVMSQSSMIDNELNNLVQAEVPVTLVCSSKLKTRISSGKLKANAAVQELMGEEKARWLMPSPGFKLRASTDQFFGTHKLKGRIVFESNVISSIARSVADDIGIAFLPLLYVAKEIQEKSVRIIGPKEGYWKYRVWLSCHSQSRNDVLLKSLAASFERVCDHAIKLGPV